MNQYAHSTATSGPDDDRTLILAVEISNRSWVVAAQVPGLRQKSAKQQLAPRADALMAAVEGYKRRAAAAGMVVDRVIVTYESGGGGVLRARALPPPGARVAVLQPAKAPAEPRTRRVNADPNDTEQPPR